MAVKVLSNIPIVEQFRIDKSSTTNISKKWDAWKYDFGVFIQMPIREEAQGVIGLA